MAVDDGLELLGRDPASLTRCDPGAIGS